MALSLGRSLEIFLHQVVPPQPVPRVREGHRGCGDAAGGRVDPGMGEEKGGHISLYWAAEGRHSRIVGLLRYRNTVSPIPTGLKTGSGRTLLPFAVENG